MQISASQVHRHLSRSRAVKRRSAHPGTLLLWAGLILAAFCAAASILFATALAAAVVAMLHPLVRLYQAFVSRPGARPVMRVPTT